jgi:hypothetical protein
VITHIRSRLLQASVSLLCSIACLFASPALADDMRTNPSTLAFAPGGAIVMKINQGEVEVVGSAEDRIRVSWQGNTRDQERKVKVRLERSGDKQARLLIDNTWDDHLRFRIEAPQRSDLAIHMRAGELKIGGIVGNMDVDLLAGEMDVRLPQPNRYRSVTASVTAGELNAKPWHGDQAGLWRSLKANGGGDFDLRARLIAGELTIRSE